MIRLLLLLLAAAVVLAGLSCASMHDKSPSTAFTLYEGIKNDQALLRKTVPLKVTNATKDTVNASSPEAIQAARRIFERVSFLFKRREEILKLLGDPATISDYNEPAKADPDSPLVYVFDSGFGGLRYTLEFQNGKCVSLQVEGIH